MDYLSEMVTYTFSCNISRFYVFLLDLIWLFSVFLFFGLKSDLKILTVLNLCLSHLVVCPLQSKDIERTIGINTDYVETTDFDMTDIDKEFCHEVRWVIWECQFLFKHRLHLDFHQNKFIYVCKYKKTNMFQRGRKATIAFIKEYVKKMNPPKKSKCDNQLSKESGQCK